MINDLSPLSIYKSVGENSANQNRDVIIIQALLNTYGAWKKPISLLKTDGRYGKNTRTAIYEFQHQAVGLNNPDTRVDPNGKTLRYLTMYLKEHEQIAIAALINNGKASIIKPKITKAIISQHVGLQKYIVSYKTTLNKEKHLVSEYSKSVIKMALKESGMSHAVITSTLRTPKEQAEIMYRNAKKDFQTQHDMYRPPGQKVLKVFKDNQNKPQNEVIKLMSEKIIDLAKNKGQRVSKHCVTTEDYLKLNIIDIGVGSTSKASKNYNAVKFTKALESLKKEGYINKYIDETRKSNQAWHLEIKVGAKPLLAKPINASILSTTRWC